MGRKELQGNEGCSLHVRTAPANGRAPAAQTQGPGARASQCSDRVMTGARDCYSATLVVPSPESRVPRLSAFLFSPCPARVIATDSRPHSVGDVVSLYCAVRLRITETTINVYAAAL